MSSQFSSSNPTILFVDSDETHAPFYQAALEARGYRVVCTNQGRQALKQLHFQKFAIAVVDTRLPNEDGLDLVNEMATSCSNMPIIIHTAAPFYANNFRSWAADAVVTKSTNATELLKQIGCLLEKH